MSSRFISGISPGFPELSQSQGQVAHVLLTRSPLIPRASPGSSFDLHVLSTPPAFVLSQDQTLREKTLSLPSAGTDSMIPRPSGVRWSVLVMFARARRTGPSPRAPNDYLASLFDTLLSSQGSSAH